MEIEYKQTKVKAAIKLYSNQEPTHCTLRLVWEFEEYPTIKDHQLLVKEAQCYANVMGISSDNSHPQPMYKDRDGKDISCEKEKNELNVATKEMGQDKIQNEKWQGKLLMAREEDQGLDRRHVLLGYGSGLCALFTQWQECMSSMSSFYRLSSLHQQEDKDLFTWWCDVSVMLEVPRKRSTYLCWLFSFSTEQITRKA